MNLRDISNEGQHEAHREEFLRHWAHIEANLRSKGWKLSELMPMQRQLWDEYRERNGLMKRKTK